MQEEEAILMLLRKISCELSSKMNKLYEPYGLTAIQFDILLELSMEDGITISQLANRMSMSVSNLSAILQRLEKHGFVNRIRDEKDQRNVRIVMGTKTTAMMDELTCCANKKDTLLNNLDEAEIKQIHQSLLKLYDMIKECEVE